MPDDQRTIHELLRAFRQLRHLNWSGMRPIEGCTPGESTMLFVVRRMTRKSDEGMKPSEIGQFLRITQPSVTQMVNVLEARGLLERTADPSDRRIVRIRLTAEGQRLTAIAEQQMNEVLEGLTDHLGQERVQLLIELLDETYRYYSGVVGITEPLCRKQPPHTNE